MSSEAIQTEKHSLWKQAAKWIVEHPQKFDFGSAAFLAGVAVLGHQSPAFTGIAGGAAAAEVMMGVLQCEGDLPFNGVHGAVRIFALLVGCGAGLSVADDVLKSQAYTDLDEKVAAFVATCPPIGSKESLKLQAGESATIRVLTADSHEEINKRVTLTQMSNDISITTKFTANIAGQRLGPNYWSGAAVFAPFSHTYEDDEALSVKCRPNQLIRAPAAALIAAQPG